jgi:hypothetical protein
LAASPAISMAYPGRKAALTIWELTSADFQNKTR